MSALPHVLQATWLIQARQWSPSFGGRKISSNIGPIPSPANLSRPAGNSFEGPVDRNGKPKDAALVLGIKLGLERRSTGQRVFVGTL
ncbi:hypothetical protein EJ07DRAFT_173771 [Lizonia empirigonia]|nr:hypothetical protein EJ07DRAFT_173771 [Lizonia empirigonia]